MIEKDGFSEYVNTPYFEVPVTSRLEAEYPENDLIDLVILVKGQWRDFKPNLVFTSIESDSTLEQALADTVKSIYQNHPGAVISGIIDFCMPHVAEGKSPIGKCLQFSYPANEDFNISTCIWLMSTGTQQLQITGSVTTWMSPMLATVFFPLVSSIKFRVDEQSLIRQAELAVGCESKLEYSQPASAHGKLVNGFKTKILLAKEGIRSDRQLLYSAEVIANGQKCIYKSYLGAKGAFVLRSSGRDCFDHTSEKLTWYWISVDQLPSDIFVWLRLQPFRRELLDKFDSENLGQYQAAGTQSAGAAQLRMNYWGEIATFELESGFVSYKGSASEDEASIPVGPIWSGNFFDLITGHIRAVLQLLSSNR